MKTKTMKWFLGILLSYVCMSGWAANSATVNRYVDDFMVRLRTEANLSTDQTNAVASILYDGIDEREDVIESYQGERSLSSMREMKKELEGVNAVMTSDVREILDPKQFEVFQKIQADNQAKLKARLKAKGQGAAE